MLSWVSLSTPYWKSHPLPAAGTDDSYMVCNHNNKNTCNVVKVMTINSNRSVNLSDVTVTFDRRNAALSFSSTGLGLHDTSFELFTQEVHHWVTERNGNETCGFVSASRVSCTSPPRLSLFRVKQHQTASQPCIVFFLFAQRKFRREGQLCSSRRTGAVFPPSQAL